MAFSLGKCTNLISFQPPINLQIGRFIFVIFLKLKAGFVYLYSYSTLLINKIDDLIVL